MKISMVGYYNTLPFVEGLKTIDVDLILDIPSKCLQYYLDEEVDVALVPVGALIESSISDYQMITDFCIGCVGSVGTVVLLSNQPVQNLSKIYLDGDSRTSAKLVQILAKHYWKVEVDFLPYGNNPIEENEGVLLIGDKVFSESENYKYQYDLGTDWESFTGLPFSFAVWIARENVSKEAISNLNNALKLGVSKIGEVDWTQKSKTIDLEEYYKEYIDYHLDDNKRLAIEKYTSLWQSMQN